MAGSRRFAARVRRRRWEWARPRLVAGAAAAAVVLGVWVVFFSSLLAVRHVTVTGTSRTSSDQVRAVAAVPVGTPLARLHAAGIRQRLHALPTVGAVRVQRRWPATVRLRIVERLPVAVLKRGTESVLVDANGVTFAPASAGGLADMVELVRPAAGPGDPATRAALGVLAALPPDLHDQVRTLSASSAASVTFTLRSGATVVWGDALDNDRKAAVLTALLRRPAKVYDVSAPGIAVTR